MTDGPHQRRCWGCGNVAEHSDSITPWVLCGKCGSQDTRRVPERDWTCGRYFDPQPEEKLRPLMELNAIDKAKQMSDCYHNEVIAVWDGKDDTHWLFINGEQFAKV